MEERTGSLLIVTEGFSEKEMRILSRSEVIGAFLCDKDGIEFENKILTCHRAIQDPSQYKVTNLISAYDGDAEGSDTFWSYISSPEGPFRDLFKIPGWKIYKVNGKIKAFSPPDEVFSFHPYALMYNFLVCTRMPAEFPHHTKTFEWLVKRNYCPHLSFLVSLFLDKGEEGFSLRSYSWNGMHLPINDTSYQRPFDFVKFKEGRYDSNISDWTRTSEIWMHRACSPRYLIGNFLFKGYARDIKSGFDSIKVIQEGTIPKLMGDFEKFMERRYR
jgi:hypothetical protein